MKKSFTIIVLALIASLASAQKGITFEVDKGLPAPKGTIPAYDEQWIATQIINVSGVPREQHHVLKTSFEGQRLCHLGDDNFFKCMVQAYADHHPLVLSPDMVWLIISQGFSRYVNAHTEEMRDLLVFHEGKMELVVNSNNNILLPTGNWERLLNDFSVCIARNTKGELADLMTADFTTTGITERIASQVSLMDVVKKYFIYSNISAACGIPSITLKGSPDDWQKVLDKVRCLKKYHLEKWVSDLEPILKEFVEASKGKPNRRFWQSIVKKIRIDEIRDEKRGCLPPKNSTRLDGWFLKFFPNVAGETDDSVIWNAKMPQEMVRVGFRHILTDPDTGEPLDTIPMQLWAGFVGVEEDAKTHALTPKIGWLARIADEESDEVARLKEQNKYMQLYFDIGKDQKVPHALSKMDRIRSLRLDFWKNPVVIPEWLDKIPIDKLSIMGQLTDEEEAQLRQRFPQVEIKRYEDIVKGLKLGAVEESEPLTPVQDDDSNNIDSVLIVVNGKQLPKSMNSQLIKPRPRMREYDDISNITVDEALKGRIGPANVNDDRHFNYDFGLKRDLRAYFLRRNEYVSDVKVLVDAAATAIYGETGANGAIEITTRPFLSVAPLSPDESKARRLKFLQDVYANYYAGHTIGTNTMFNHDGFIYNGEDHAFDPDLFDTPVEEQFFGQMTNQHGHKTSEYLGPLGSDTRGIYVPLIREVEIKLPANVDQNHVDSVVNAIRQAARQADKSIERTDSLVRMAFIFGGKVKEGKPHPFKTFPINEGGSSEIESRYYFTPDAKAESSWWAEAYFKATHPRQLFMHLISVDKLYASDCPAILENRCHIEGSVLDYNTGAPVADALVYIEATMGISDAGGVGTDKNGRFDLWLPHKDDVFRVSKSGYIDAYWNQPADTALIIRLRPMTSLQRQPSRIRKDNTVGKGVKAGDTISGTVSDETGSLMGATVCEINANGRIVESGITDMNGAFKMKVINPEDRIRFSYVGMKTVTVPIDKKEYKIKMEPVRSLYDYRLLRRRTGSSSLPIPKRDVTELIDMSEFEGLAIEYEGSGVSNENNPRGYIPLTDEVQALVTPVNDLGFDMFRKVGAKKSVLLSPMGMTYALGLISNGADGQTKKQIYKVLGCDDTKTANINEFCRKMLTETPKLDRLTQMKINNDFFSHNGFTPKPAFEKIAEEYYHTELSSLDFGNWKSVDEINQKISQRTNGMLPKVLDKSNLDPMMGFALTNTIYFKGIWTDKFPKALTRDEVFKCEDGREKMLPMMNQTHKFYYSENELCQALCLPYSNEAFQMIILLPKEGKTVSEVAQSLTADNWQRSCAQMRRVLVDVKLPRFESSSDVELTGVMSALGISDAFHMGKADFSNLFDLKSHIGMISQVGRIKVDETGTEATIAEALQGRIAGLDLTPPEMVSFYATHPFLYVIREVSTGAIFFIGQYMD